MTAMPDLKHDTLHIQLTQEGAGLTVHWRGASEARDPGLVLDPYLKQLAGQIKGAVTVDFTQFGFMNSSTVPPIITFLRDLNDRAIPARVVYDGEQTWQRMSFNGMRALSMMLKNVTVVNSREATQGAR